MMEQKELIEQVAFDLIDITKGSLNEIELISDLFLIAKDSKEKSIEILKNDSVINYIQKAYKNIRIGNIDENLIRNILGLLLDYRINDTILSEIYDKYIEVYRVKSLIDFNTPKSINDLICSLLGDISKKTIYDGCAGIGDSVINLIRHNKDVKVLCQEINKENSIILETRLKLLNANYEIEQSSTLQYPKFLMRNNYDYATMDWPFGMSINNGDMIEVEKRKDVYVHGIPSQASSILLIIQQVLYSLKNQGKAIFVVPTGILYKSGKDEKVRKSILNMDVIETIIALPSKMYSNTNIQTNLVIINKNKKNDGYIQFINASTYGKDERNKTILEQNNVNKIIEIYNSKKEEKNISKNVKITDIENANLDCSSYISNKVNVVKTNYFNEIIINEEEVKNILKKSKVKKLKEIASFYRGINILKSEDNENGKYKVLNMSALQDGNINYNDIIRNDLSKFTNIEKGLIEKDDILISCKGEAIKISMVKEEVNNYTITQSSLGIRVNNSCTAKYLAMYLDSPIGRYLISKIQKGAFIPMISIKDLENLEIIIPNEDEQEKIIREFEIEEEIIEEQLKELESRRKENRIKLYKKVKIDTVFEDNM